MEGIAIFLIFASFIYIIVGTINPKFVPKAQNRSQAFFLTTMIMLVVTIIGVNFMEEPEAKTATPNKQVVAEQTQQDKEAEELAQAEAKDNLQKDVLNKMDSYILTHVSEFEIDKVGNKWYQLKVYIKQGVTDDSARKIAMHTVKAIIDDLVKQGRQPSDEKVDVFVTVGQKAKGVTGKDLYRTIGMSSYDWRNDQIKWEWL